MASNVRRYGENNHVALNVANLKEGDELVRVIRSGNSWGAVGTRREVAYTVKKVLKSRLVLESSGRELRMLVTNSKTWVSRNGEVETSYEGQAGGYSRETIVLYTPDDEYLAADRESFAKAEADAIVKREATESLETFKRQLSIENAQDAIAKLQAWVDAQDA